MTFIRRLLSLRPGIVLITVIALMIRLRATTVIGLGPDEANGVAIAITGSWQDMLLHLKEDGNAPVFYTIVRLVCHFFGALFPGVFGADGQHDFVVKGLAIAISTLQIPITYLLLRSSLPRHLNLQICFLLAVTPSLVRWGTMIRPYGLMSILGLVSSCACVRVLTKGTSKWWVPIYGVSTALVVCTHYWGAFVPIGQAVLAAWGWLRRWFEKQQLHRWLVGVTISLIVFAPQVPVLIYQLTHDLSPWDMVPDLLALGPQFFAGILLDAPYGDQRFILYCILICNFLIYLTLISPSVTVIEDKKNVKVFDGRLWKALTIGSLLAGFAVNVVLPAMRYRYTTTFVPLIFIVYVTGIDALFRRYSIWLRFVIGCVIFVLLSYPQLRFQGEAPETDSLTICTKINVGCDPKKDLVVVATPVLSPSIYRYLLPNINAVTFPDLKRLPFNYWPGMSKRIRNEEIFEELLALIDKTIKNGGRVWIVEMAHILRQRDYRDNDMVQNVSFLEASLLRLNQMRTFLSERSMPEGTNMMVPGRDFNVFLSVHRPLAPGEEPVKLPVPLPTEGEVEVKD